MNPMSVLKCFETIMPTRYRVVSLSENMEIKKEGYEPSFSQIKIILIRIELQNRFEDSNRRMLHPASQIDN